MLVLVLGYCYPSYLGIGIVIMNSYPMRNLLSYIIMYMEDNKNGD